MSADTREQITREALVSEFDRIHTTIDVANAEEVNALHQWAWEARHKLAAPVSTSEGRLRDALREAVRELEAFCNYVGDDLFRDGKPGGERLRQWAALATPSAPSTQGAYGNRARS